ncbi:class I SAM-dependent methyltransferase [Beggiatoa leptomitoformis]|uniref:Methyltransferase domain-containing protein n=1 Tax=Beggiatoa leptomitoformis TaxID=288004 RepID=A0A2N9YFC7_9GAMM|nr:class I SAM-dependent methyltransferase [Beggiatoa leptomitoformis]ALG68437.1 methyltransferase domain-containing protein [Beggiatoa leptomitoformis]AUI69231.1 methyltransferase domain-containing protein [Beggiatoa leptomitoformis]
MHRVPEPELMLDDEQARAYARADFEDPHSLFVQRFADVFLDAQIVGYVLDLGCGAGDISRRFAQRYPHCQIHGVDGSSAMLKYGREMLVHYDLEKRIQLLEGYLPGAQLPEAQYDVIISNSLLHHLVQPMVLWETIKAKAKADGFIFIMDFMRPESFRQAEIMVQHYAGSEPSVLRRDFYNSLLAAYRIDEVNEQLKQADLDYLKLHEVSDRHFVVMGRFQG